ncbi:MAG: hypothetical protein ACFFAO_17435 [Candidatus Hermodarchaeota archaeon]
MSIEEEAKSRMKWISHKGKDILFEDYTNVSYSKFPELIIAVKNITIENGYRDYLLLIDFTDSYADKNTMDVLLEAAKETKPFINKTAVLGITGIKKVLLNSINFLAGMGVKAFNSEEEAKEWLAE